MWYMAFLLSVYFCSGILFSVNDEWSHQIGCISESHCVLDMTTVADPGFLQEGAPTSLDMTTVADPGFLQEGAPTS